MNVLSRIDEDARRRFEAAWRVAAPADLHAFLPPRDAPTFVPTLVELVGIDMELRFKKATAGLLNSKSLQDYIVDYPILNDSTIRGELQEQETALLGRMPKRPSIPDCEVQRELGQGGMGVVYLARQITLNRLVAVKTLHAAAQARLEHRTRFFHEAEAVARLQHANIVAIHHIGHDADVPYFLMEYVDGGTLADKLKNGPLAPAEAAHLVATLARAVESAHQRGIIHRDLKPANILLVDGDCGTPKITDFGLAKSLQLDSHLTQTGHLIGTPSYMAPEQTSGPHAVIATTTDVYALGAVLYETLTGRPPFQRETLLATLDDVCNREPVPPSKLRPGLSRDLETICLQCLQKDPARRYARAELLAEDLHRYRDHRPIHARRTSLVGVAARWCRRNPALALAAVIVLAVVAAATWNVLQERDRFRTERDRAEANLYTSLTAQAAGHLESRGPEWWWKATEALAAASKLPQRNDDELRDLYVRCLGTYHYALRVKMTWTGGEPATKIIVSTDGTFTALIRGSTVELKSIANGDTLQAFTAFPDKPTALAFHPQSHALVIAAGSSLLLANRSSAAFQNVGQSTDGAEITALSINPAGTRLLAGTDRGTVLAFKLNANGTLEGGPKTVHTAAASIIALDDSPRGDQFAVSDRGRTFTAVRNDGGEAWSYKVANPYHAVRYSDTGDYCLAVDPLGFGFSIVDCTRKYNDVFLHLHDNSIRRAMLLKRGMLTASADGSIRIWGREASKPLTLWTRSRAEFGPILDAELLPDETGLVVSYGDGTVRVWEIFEPAARTFFGTGWQSVAFVGDESAAFDGLAKYRIPNRFTPQILPPEQRHGDTVWSVAASDDGQLVASGDHLGKVKLWTPDLEPRGEVVHGKELVWTAAFRPGTHTLAAAGTDIAVWNMDTHAELLRLPGHHRLTLGLAFHPTRPWLASCGKDRFVRVWNIDQKALMAETLLPHTPHCVTVSADGRWLVAGCDDGRVLVWDCDAITAAMPPPAFELSGHTSPVRAVAFSKDGVLASGAEGGVITLRDSRQDFRKLVNLQSVTGQVRSLQFRRDGAMLISGHYVSNAVAWDLVAIRKELAALNLDWKR